VGWLIPAATVFVYQLQINSASSCNAVGYRRGNCCNQTLDGISFAMTEEAKAQVRRVAGSTGVCTVC
jgi:hypothetical protein